MDRIEFHSDNLEGISRTKIQKVINQTLHTGAGAVLSPAQIPRTSHHFHPPLASTTCVALYSVPPFGLMSMGLSDWFSHRRLRTG